jgi:clan AA aspartic protease
LDAVIDTGFNGALTLPLEIIRSLSLIRRAPRSLDLADGSTVILDMYKANIGWNGGAQDILVFAAEGDALIGMALLTGYNLTVDVIIGGRVSITKLQD